MSRHVWVSHLLMSFLSYKLVSGPLTGALPLDPLRGLASPDLLCCSLPNENSWRFQFAWIILIKVILGIFWHLLGIAPPSVADCSW